MATELSNYDNDYRERYRTQTTASITGWETAQAANNVVRMPDETQYGLYADGSGTLADPYNSETFQPAVVSTDLVELADVSKVTGDFQGRYSLDFAITEDGDVGEPLSIADVSVPRGANPPANPVPGNLWFDTNNLQLMVYIDDGNSTQWVAAS